jgi:hypothetical protein
MQIFISQMKYGIYEMAKMSAAIVRRATGITTPPENHYEHLAQGIVDAAEAHGEPIASGWASFKEDQLVNKQTLLNMAFLNIVAMFDAVITDIFSAVLVACPEIMLRVDQTVAADKEAGTEKTLTYDSILSASSIDELIDLMVAKEMNKYNFLSVKKQWESYGNRFGVRLDAQHVNMNKVADIVAKRNLLAHKKGIADQRYLQSVPEPSLKLGESVRIDDETFGEYSALLEKVVKLTVVALQEKYCKNP